MNGLAWSANRIWRLIAMISLTTGLLLSPAVAGQAQNDVPLDLAALTLRSEDLDWLVEELDLVDTEGYPYATWFSTSQSTIDEVMSDDVYAPGRGALDLTLPIGNDVADVLEETDWIRTQSQILVLPEPGQEEELWSLGVGVSIEEFANAEEAEAAFTAFGREDSLAELGQANSIESHDTSSIDLDAPTVMWEMWGSRWDGFGGLLTLWALLDNRIVSVAFYSSDHDLPDSDVLVSLLDTQLKRLHHAEKFHQPGLSYCAPRFDSDQVVDQHEEYAAINGRPLATAFSTSYDDLADDLQVVESAGIVHSYLTSQSISDTAIGVYDGTLWFAGQVRTFIDERHASSYLAATEERLEEAIEFSKVVKIDAPSDLGDAAVAFNYDGGDDYPASIILFQVGETVYSIRLGSMMEYQPEAVIALAETQLARLDDGNCDEPLELPNSLMANLTPSSRETTRGS